MTSPRTDPHACPYTHLHGNRLGYCPKCGWEAPTPAPNDALGELTTLILGKTATAAAQAILAAGYSKAYAKARTTAPSEDSHSAPAPQVD